MKACCEVAAMFQQVCLDCNFSKRSQESIAKHVKAKNLCAKTVKRENAYEVWQAGDWTWYVLKKWQADDDKPYARWFCNVVTPMVGPEGETGDVYVSEIKKNARRIK
jgi:hypothetical protein